MIICVPEIQSPTNKVVFFSIFFFFFNEIERRSMLKDGDCVCVF